VMALLTKKKLIDLVEKDLLVDPALQYIVEDQRSKTVKLVIATTNPKNPAVEYRQLAKDLLRLSNQDWTKPNEKAVQQKILKTLIRLQRGNHYISDHEISEKTKKNIQTYKVKGEVFIANLHAVLLGGEFMNDQIRAYVDCHHAFTIKMRGYLEANDHLADKKRTTMVRYKMQRAHLQGGLEEVGINSNFGIGAQKDKYILNKLIPSPDGEKINQHQMLMSARGDNKVYKGSCISALNPTELAFVDVINARINHSFRRKIDEFIGTPDEKAKRQKFMDVYKEVVNGASEALRYEGVSSEENAKLFYDPATAVEKHVQDNLMIEM